MLGNYSAHSTIDLGRREGDYRLSVLRMSIKQFQSTFDQAPGAFVESPQLLVDRNLKFAKNSL